MYVLLKFSKNSLKFDFYREKKQKRNEQEYLLYYVCAIKVGNINFYIFF